MAMPACCRRWVVRPTWRMIPASGCRQARRTGFPRGLGVDAYPSRVFYRVEDAGSGSAFLGEQDNSGGGRIGGW